MPRSRSSSTRRRSRSTAVIGRPWSEATLQAAATALDTDFTPLSDLRASADYRRQVARALLKRFWLETRTKDALAPASSSVWVSATAVA